jgi:hypothetical protein
MNRRRTLFILIGLIGIIGLLYSTTVTSQPQAPTVPDAVQEAQNPREVQSTRPEQQQTPHDQSDIFGAASAPSSSPVLETQPDQGKMLGFDFARDPLDAKQPTQTPEEIMKNDTVKPKVTAAQQQLLERRYDLKPKLEGSAKMSRGKPLPVGPTARLQGITWQNLAKVTPTRFEKEGSSPTPLYHTPSTPLAEWFFPLCRSKCFRG